MGTLAGLLAHCGCAGEWHKPGDIPVSSAHLPVPRHQGGKSPSLSFQLTFPTGKPRGFQLLPEQKLGKSLASLT